MISIKDVPSLALFVSNAIAPKREDLSIFIQNVRVPIGGIGFKRSKRADRNNITWKDACVRRNNITELDCNLLHR